MSRNFTQETEGYMYSIMHYEFHEYRLVNTLLDRGTKENSLGRSIKGARRRTHAKEHIKFIADAPRYNPRGVR